ncbi:DUF1761 domain-containing protein [Flavobacterium restrictum]|uniref:DUF1761 domain-containing protein n=1 Tax=Flavobacterium restrictum TaxID=2594428 RepID=A0A553E9E1_9FLAO|nr:DUF1761 domain-containing protein [Flavobacterium restrictum]TRX41542.1 DUF1761 domain-containing protein [Flavobacterium restrictum]
MEINFLAILVAAVSTVVVGFVWYHPKVFGGIWMRESGLTEDKMKGVNRVKMLLCSIIYAFFMAFILRFLVIHQTGALGMVGGDATKALPSYNAFLDDYGTAFRTFKHGALHGFMTGLLMILPVIGTNALYERRSFKYTMVTGGFWIVCFTIMGAIICGWS